MSQAEEKVADLQQAFSVCGKSSDKIFAFSQKAIDSYWCAICTVISLAVVELMLVPIGVPQPNFSLDDSWRMALCAAFAHHLQFGTDFVFTMGPLGFLYSRLPDPATYWLRIGLWSLLACGWWVEIRCATQSIIKQPAWQLAFIVLCTVIASNTDQLVYSWALIGIINRELLRQNPGGKRDFVWGACLGILSLAKFSFFAVIGMLLIVGSMLSHLYRRPLIFWGLAVALGWLGAGQKLTGFLSYLRNSLELASGYSLAMSLQTFHNPLLIVCVCLIMPLIAGASLWFAAGNTPRLQAIRLAILQIIACLGIEKSACTRMDTHAVIAVQVWLLEAALLYFIIRASIKTPRWRSDLVAAAVGLSLGIMFWCRDSASGSCLPLAYRVESLAGAIGKITSGFPDRNFAVSQQLLRADFGIPKISGTLDVFPNHCGAAMAAGDYRGRPVPQAYSCYSRRLEELNAQFMHSDKAPQFILFEPAAIDKRYPTLADSQTWLEMIARYEPLKQFERFQLLRRKKAATAYHLVSLGTFPCLFNHPVNVPSSKDSLIWVEIAIRPTLFGLVQSAIFHILPPSIDVSFSDGGVDSYRIPINMARAGFLLSPLIKTNSDMRQLISKKSATAIPSGHVLGFVVNDSSCRSWWQIYIPHFSAHFYKVAFAETDGNSSKAAAK